MKDKEFLLRSFSAVFIIAANLYFVFTKCPLIAGSIILILMILMAYEWKEITLNNKELNVTQKRRLDFLGIFYIIATLFPILFLKVNFENPHLLMWLILLIWMTDTFAYIVGAKMGLNKHKITKISPKKSYEGLFGGMIAACVFGFVYANFFLPEIKFILLAITPLLCVLEQISDIIESHLKRKFNVKDSGYLIPGHGGIVDRFDGFLLTTITYILFLTYLI